MRANPGGQLDPTEVIGRDQLIENLWHVLEQQSVLLTAERRIGKTQVIKKMVAEADAERLLTIYRDLEGVRTPLEFVEHVFYDVERYLSRKQKWATRTRNFLQEIAGSEIGEVVRFPDAAAPHWKRLLERTIEDLVTQQDRRVVFFWDEVPLMLHNLVQRGEGDAVAMEMLDVLRQLRQMHADLRMVFTGSIGLHNVITALRRAGYANDPTNDMRTIDVPPLRSAAAVDLALQLLEGENIVAAEVQATAETIARAVDQVPYYIHHIVSDLRFTDEPVTPDLVRTLVARRLRDPQDEWRMTHYRERVNTYYDDEEQPIVLAILDVLADEARSFAQLFNLVKTQVAVLDEEEERVRNLVRLLQRDHYIELGADDAYRFRFPLIRRWWRINRG
ncbi:MAG: ATP-binding protein [Bacteroidetes bacterium]|jgi:hypothetical protein|nr:ATP-binding protein [Bacteroidota bacterium]